MNSKPWPPYPMVTPVNTGATSESELQGVISALNSIISQYNELTQFVGGIADQVQWLLEHMKEVESGTVEEYDGDTPAHDDLPWVITNGVLKEWPGTDPMTLGTSEAVGMKLYPGSTRINVTKYIAPLVDDTMALYITNADGTKDVIRFDTVNLICYPNRLVVP